MDSIEDIIAATEQLIVDRRGKPLIFIQKAILKESLLEEKPTYAAIAQKYNYSEGYIKKVAAPQLWQLLSQILEDKVNKYNCRILLEQKLAERSLIANHSSCNESPQFAIEFPEGHVPLNSRFYIARANLESTCYREISQPGAFLRLKAPRKMGKTSLATRIMAYGNTQNYKTAYLSLEQVETEIFSSIGKFLRWLCVNIARQWGIASKLDEYWDEDMGALVSCSIYLQNYLLKQLSHPGILILDEVDRVFEYPNIAHDLLALLRGWHEKSKDLLLWQKLRLVIVNSTDAYLSLNTNRSPFNVGLTVDLPFFSRKEIADLIQRHQLKIDNWEIEELVKLTGGHPYLLRLALYESFKQNISLKTLLQETTDTTKIFDRQLHYLLWNLKCDRDLWSNFQQVLKSSTKLEPEAEFKLASLGLVTLNDNEAKVSCGLYQNYFSQHLFLSI